MSNQYFEYANTSGATAYPNIFNEDKFIEPVYDLYLVDLIRKQIEYYFSKENLEKDIFLRERMDKDGFIPLSLIMSFANIKCLTRDREKIILAVETSYELEIKNNKVRTLDDPEKWPIPFKEGLIDGDDDVSNFHPLGQPKLSTKEIDISPTEHDILPKSDIPYPTEPFFISKESSNLLNVTPKALPGETASCVNFNPSETKENIGNFEQPTTSADASGKLDSSNQEDSFEPQKDKSKKDKTFPYKLYKRAILERNFKGPGKSSQMNKLYKQWCYHLSKNLNKSHYETFKTYALEDNSYGYRYGIECLFRFFSYGLENIFIKELFLEFQYFTLMDFQQGYLYGLEKFWAFMYFNKIQEPVMDELREILSHYKCIEDFKVNKVGASQLNPEAPEFIPKQQDPDNHAPGSPN